MAYVTGTATDAQDFWDKLLLFLTTNATLVGAGQDWEVVWSGSGAYADDLVIKGPGLTGTDEVYVGMRLEQNATEDQFSIIFCGLAGYLTGGLQYNDHVNPSISHRIFLDSNPSTYWFVGNGRRFMAVAKITTVFEAMYAGLYHPYAFPTTYPYPLFVGGSAPGNSLLASTWRSAEESHRHFVDPFYDSNIFGTSLDPAAAFIDPAGEWTKVSNWGDVVPGEPAKMAPFNPGDGLGGTYYSNNAEIGYGRLLNAMRPTFGGGYALTPLTLVKTTGGDVTYGVLDGAYHVAGFGNGAENIIQIGGIDHLVVQNTFRTLPGSYWAMKLE